MQAQNLTNFCWATLTFFTCLVATTLFLCVGGGLLGMLHVLPAVGFWMMCLPMFMGLWFDGLSGATGSIYFSDVWFISVGIWLTTGILIGIATRRSSTWTQVGASVVAIASVTVLMNLVLALFGLRVYVEVL